MHHYSAALTTSGVQKLRTKLNHLKTRYECITSELKDRNENRNILIIKQLEREFLEFDLLRLEQTLSNVKIIDKIDHPTKAQQGTKVIYTQIDSDEQNEITLVDPLEADPSEGFVSIKSPVGSALFGHHVDETISIKTPKGINQLRIVELY